MLSEGQCQIRDMARRFAQRELAPTVAERDRTPRFPREAFARMGELGMLGMTVPAEFDGADADYVSYALAIMEIAAALPDRAGRGIGRRRHHDTRPEDRQ